MLTRTTTPPLDDNNALVVDTAPGSVSLFTTAAALIATNAVCAPLTPSVVTVEEFAVLHPAVQSMLLLELVKKSHPAAVMTLYSALW